MKAALNELGDVILPLEKWDLTSGKQNKLVGRCFILI